MRVLRDMPCLSGVIVPAGGPACRSGPEMVSDVLPGGARHWSGESAPRSPPRSSSPAWGPDYARELLRDATSGIGYLLKQRVSDLGEFLVALDRVAAGETVLDNELYRELLVGPARRDTADQLTDRERQVLELVATGLSNAAIRIRLSISERAVEKHVTSILTKLRIPGSPDGNRRVLAVLDYLRGTGRV